MHQSDRMFNDLQSLQDRVKFLQKHYMWDVLSLKYFRIQDGFFVFSMQTFVIFPCHDCTLVAHAHLFEFVSI